MNKVNIFKIGKIENLTDDNLFANFSDDEVFSLKECFNLVGSEWSDSKIGRRLWLSLKAEYEYRKLYDKC